MKVRGLLFGGLSTLALVLTACPSPAIGLGISSVTFSTASVAKQALTVGDTFTYQATANRMAGNTTAAQTVTYTSSNASVLTVGSTTGVASGIAAGTATITAKSTVDTSKTAGLTVTVSAVATTTVVAARVNAGGVLVTASDAPNPNWAADITGTFVCHDTYSAPAIPVADNAGTKDPGDGTVTGTGSAPTISVAGVNNAAPAAVYASNHFCNNSTTAGIRQGDQLVYTPTALATGTYTVRLHFSENYWGATGTTGFNGGAGTGKRVMSVAINGAVATATGQSSANVDVFALATSANKALVLDYPGVVVSSTATLKLTLTAMPSTSSNGGDPFVSGVELIRTGA